MIFGLYHTPTEPAGLIKDEIKRLKLPFQEVHLYEGDGLPRDISDLEGLVVMGGSMNVDQVHQYPFLLPEVQLIEKVLRKGKPVLGICLGSQLIAKALGSRIYPNKYREVGWHPIELTPHARLDPHFSEFPTQQSVLHWHGDTFDLPEDAVHLAKSEKCENQAFRWGPSTYGIQFHLEATPPMIKEWIKTPEDKKFIKSAGEDPKEILRLSPQAFKKLEPAARAFYASYFQAAFGSLLTAA